MATARSRVYYPDNLTRLSSSTWSADEIAEELRDGGYTKERAFVSLIFKAKKPMFLENRAGMSSRQCPLSVPDSIGNEMPVMFETVGNIQRLWHALCATRHSSFCPFLYALCMM